SGRMAGLSLDGGYNRFNYYLGGTYKKTDEVETPKGRLDNSAVEDYNYSGGVNYSWEKMSLGLSGFGSRADIEVPNFENNFKKARFEDEQHHAVFLNFESKKMSDAWTSLKIDGAFQRHNRRMRIINPSDQQIKVDVDFDTFNLNPQTTFKFGAVHTVITGLQTLFESEKSDRMHPSPLINGVGVIPPSTRLGLGAFAQDEISVTDRFTVTAGLRYDWFRSENKGEDGHPVEAVTENDGSVSGSLGLLYGVVKNRVNLTANAGRAFRAPTLHERFFYGPHQGTADYGNPNLDPETAWNFDAGVKMNFERLWFALSGFYNRIDDYIEKRLTGGTEFGLPKAEYANVSEAELYGGEVETELKTGFGLSVFGNMGYVRGKNLTSNENLSSIPPLKGSYGLRYERMAGAMNLWSELSFHSAAEQADPGLNESKTHGYTTVDIRAEAKIDKRLSVTVYCKNLADKAYHDHLSRISPANAPEVDGLEQPGRSFGGSVKLYF
ncbi:MAG TPA: TonB-dependent receptor, partial [Spirochaetes bacterium]|nr:TonB-dependent receptor [Spirochaetota bacterium]